METAEPDIAEIVLQSVTEVPFPHEAKIAMYKRLLALHDWQFEHCDNYRIWGAGKAQRNVLDALRREIDQDAAIWNSHAPIGHRFSRMFCAVPE